MRPPDLVAPRPPTTPADAAPVSRVELPADLLQEASRRVAIMALIAAALWFIGSVLGHVAHHAMYPEDARWLSFGSIDIVSSVGLSASLALSWYASRPQRNPKRILDLGLAYMVLMAATLSLMLHIEPIPGGRTVIPMISWVGVVTLMSAAIVPSRPRKMLVASFVAVSMNPLSMLIARARGTWNFPSVTDAVLMHYPDYLLAGVAVVISHVVTRLGQQVVKARQMGSYQLGELLGRGGMGEVYHATHRLLARPAAIKLIRPEMLGTGNTAASQRVLTRFRREAETAARLRSPHTVALYDFGVTQDQTMYFVMELLDGLDLESLVRQFGPLPAGRTMYLLRQVCESLEEAHAGGLVHRDIKPANIHVGRLGLQHDFVKVLDFGLVKSMDAVDVGQTLATGDGRIVGTPAYMAPEMVLGEAIDARTDLYALGCVAYFLLTGRQVFEADQAIQLITKHLQAEPARPSAQTELPVPPALDDLVLACLAKKPADRPASAATLARALASIDVEPWGEEQAKAWWDTHRPSG
jgi:serine/threonine-protein kinase